jgi:biopolymer transport protein ExbD
VSRRHHYRRRTKESPELDVTTFLNLMVVLVPFLLITAVFSRITIVELNLPTTAGGPASLEPEFRVEVIVREGEIEISNGTAIIARIPNVDDEYDLPTLGEYMMSLKGEYPDIIAASVLLEPDIPYDYLIQVMDVVRSAEIPADSPEGRALLASLREAESEGDAGATEEPPEFVRLALFTEISIGDAP